MKKPNEPEKIEDKKKRYAQMIVFLSDGFGSRMWTKQVIDSLWDEYFKKIHSSMYSKIAKKILVLEKYPPQLPRIRQIANMIVEEEQRAKPEEWHEEGWIDLNLFNCKYCQDCGMLCGPFADYTKLFCTYCDVADKKFPDQKERDEILLANKKRREAKLKITLSEAFKIATPPKGVSFEENLTNILNQLTKEKKA